MEMLNWMELTSTQNLLRCPTEIREEAIAENKLIAFDMKETVIMDTVTGEVKGILRRPWNFRTVERDTLHGV